MREAECSESRRVTERVREGKKQTFFQVSGFNYPEETHDLDWPTEVYDPIIPAGVLICAPVVIMSTRSHIKCYCL